MSYNVDRVEILESKRFRIKKSVLLAYEDRDDDLPESNFVWAALSASKNTDAGEDVLLETLEWTGVGSGHSWDLFLEILEKTEGFADIVTTWEGGDSVTGLRVRNGQVTPMFVERYLSSVEKKPGARPPPTVSQMRTVYALAGSSAGLSDELCEKLALTPEEEFELVREFVDDPETFKLSDSLAVLQRQRALAAGGEEDDS